MHTHNDSHGGSYAYTGLSPTGNAGRATGSPVYVPATFSNYYYWYSDVVVQNTGTAATNVTITYYASNGNTAGSATYNNLAPNANYTFSGAGSGSASAAKISSSNSQSLAVIAIHHRNNAYESHSGFTSGATTLYAPALMNDYYGWNTALTLQNLGTGSTTIYVDYYSKAGNFVKTTTLSGVPAHGYRSLYTPADGLATGHYSAVVRSSSQPVAATTTISSGLPVIKGMAYEVFQAGSDDVVFPWITSHYSSDDWVSAVVVQNAGNSNTTATLTLSNGNHVASDAMQPGRLYEWYMPVLISWFGGSGVVSTNNQPVVAINNHNGAAHPASDWAFSYSGDVR